MDCTYWIYAKGLNQLQDALSACKLMAGENSAPFLNELLRGTNAADFSKKYFRQHNFLPLAPGFALRESSQWEPGLFDESWFWHTYGKRFLITAQLCWCHSQMLPGLGGCDSCGKQLVLLRNTKTKRPCINTIKRI